MRIRIEQTLWCDPESAFGAWIFAKEGFPKTWDLCVFVENLNFRKGGIDSFTAPV